MIYITTDGAKYSRKRRSSWRHQSRKSLYRIFMYCLHLNWKTRWEMGCASWEARHFVSNIRRRKCSPLNSGPTWLVFDSTWQASVASESTGRVYQVLHEDPRLWLHTLAGLLCTNSLEFLPTLKLRDASLTRPLPWRLWTIQINQKFIFSYS